MPFSAARGPVIFPRSVPGRSGDAWKKTGRRSRPGACRPGKKPDRQQDAKTGPRRRPAVLYRPGQICAIAGRLALLLSCRSCCACIAFLSSAGRLSRPVLALSRPACWPGLACVLSSNRRAFFPRLYPYTVPAGQSFTGRLQSLVNRARIPARRQSFAGLQAAAARRVDPVFLRYQARRQLCKYR